VESEFDLLKKEVLLCTKCVLCKTRKNVVFGEGNTNAKIILIGEGPGNDEDIQGRPFVGRSGQLLDKILDSCGFNRKDHVFIGNIVKCRPPQNRVPLPEEREACVPYLLKQVELINPKIIILLGATALSLVNPALKISKARGSWLSYNNRLVMPTYHPSALLRNPNLKSDTWEDFKKVFYKYKELVDNNHVSKYIN